MPSELISCWDFICIPASKLHYIYYMYLFANIPVSGDSTNKI